MLNVSEVQVPGAMNRLAILFEFRSLELFSLFGPMRRRGKNIQVSAVRTARSPVPANATCIIFLAKSQAG